MEENKNAKQSKGSFLLGYFILTALICVCAGLGLTFPMTALLAACVAVFPWWGAIAPASGAALCAYLIYPQDTSYVLTVVFFTALAVVTGIMLRKKAPCRITLLVVCALMLVFMLGINVIDVPGITSDTNGIMLIRDAEAEAELASYGIDVDGFLFSVLSFSAIIEGGLVFAFSRIAAILLTLIPAFGARARRNDIVPFMSPFTFWMLSKNYTIGLITAAAAVIAVNVMGLPNAEIITYVTVTVFLTPIFVQGVCFMRFLSFTLRKRGIGIVILLYVGCGLLMPISFIALGLYDQFMRIRAKRVSVTVVKTDVHGSNDNDSRDSGDSSDDDNSDSGEV